MCCGKYKSYGFTTIRTKTSQNFAMTGDFINTEVEIDNTNGTEMIETGKVQLEQRNFSFFSQKANFVNFNVRLKFLQISIKTLT